MKPENDQKTEEAKKPKDESFIKELGKDVGKGLLQETGSTLKWAAGGAVLGALVLGGLGLWKFGLIGLGIGAAAGAILGAVAGGWFYLSV
jgi:hypothetical protein